MDTVDLSLSTPTEVIVNAESHNTTSVQIDDVKKSDVLDHFDPEDIANHFNHSDLLKYIDQDEAVEYYKLELKET